MRITMVAMAAAMAVVCARAEAAVITETGTVFRNVNTEYSDNLTYSFAAISVPGTVTSISFDFSGGVQPGLTANTFGQVNSVTLKAGAYIAAPDFSSLAFIGPTTITSQTATAPRISGTNLLASGTLLPITLHADVPVNSFELAGLASGPILVDVRAFTQIATTNGTGQIDVSSIQDRSSVSGGLTLSINYTPVPEPIGASLLLVPMLGMAALRRYT